MNREGACGVSGCGGVHHAKGYCDRHYRRWRSTGCPHTPGRVQAPNGSGTLSVHGYRLISVNGKQIREHRYIMEQHIGRKLGPQEVVHHINRDKLDNRIENLLLLPDRAAHRKVHQWEDAYQVSGHHHWRKCKYCKEYDAPENMYISPGGRAVYHRECHNKYKSERRGNS